MQNANRVEVANLRGDYRLQAETLKLQKASPSEQIKYRGEARKALQFSPQFMTLPQNEQLRMIDEEAGRAYSVDQTRGLTRKPEETGINTAIAINLIRNEGLTDKDLRVLDEPLLEKEAA